MEKDLVDVVTAAERLNVHPNTVRLWLATSRLRGCRLPNGRYRIPRAAIEELATPTLLQARHAARVPA
jgi:excisionase family DNA binding protein